MSKILIVEDEAQIARFVELELIHEGNTVDKQGEVFKAIYVTCK